MIGVYPENDREVVAKADNKKSSLQVNCPSVPKINDQFIVNAK